MQDVAGELRALHGTASPPGPGLLHVMHVARAASGRLSALRVGAPGAPVSETDFFLLNASRAHADALLTSAANLRSEPALRHTLQGAWAQALARYRHDVLHKSAPLTCAILTRTGDLPDPHPVWSDGTERQIFAPDSAAPALQARFGTRARVVTLPELDALHVARHLQAQGAAVVSVEAGPSTVRALYAQGAVQELWLTHWETARPDAELAGELPDDGQLFRGLSLVGSARREEHGQRFRFERWRASGA